MNVLWSNGSTTPSSPLPVLRMCACIPEKITPSSGLPSVKKTNGVAFTFTLDKISLTDKCSLPARFSKVNRASPKQER
ncbi:unannotated protein [freshwater metagenome]|uniref:Unannotated protein n=1 Tax=freshwater metagenome TaxID=449393 RepID=A0A6J7V6U9_9ZZZZ